MSEELYIGIRTQKYPSTPLSTSLFAVGLICLPVYLFVSSQVFQSVGVTNADAVYVRQHCLYLVLGAVGCSQLYGLYFLLWLLVWSWGYSAFL